MSLEEYKADIYHCIKCGACRTGYGSFLPICPSGEKYGFNSYYAQGRLDLAKALLENRIEWSEKLLHRLYTCTDCNACHEMCYQQTSIRPTKVIREMKYLAVERGILPPGIRDFLKSIALYGNPYKANAEDRGRWAEGTGVKAFSGEEFLLYVGCVASYDDRAIKIAKALSNVLKSAHVSFGILGREEKCDGNEVHLVGDKWLFQVIAEQNIQKFKELGVKRIIVLSPHSWNAFRNEYGKFGCEFEALHYTQLMQDLIKDGQLTFPGEVNARVAYHDSCYLGRHNGEYESPRAILQSIQGVELIEMERNRDNAFCCGGGGGNFFSDILGVGENSPARIRVREARDTGCEILAVACPICAGMLSDAVKIEELEKEIQVRDIAEIAVEAMAVRE
jgi:Fe-S oxidoreductase